MTTLRYSGIARTAAAAPVRGPGAWFRVGVQRLRAASARRGHDRELAAMSDHDLADLGIGRSEVPALLQREPVSDREIRVRGIL